LKTFPPPIWEKGSGNKSTASVVGGSHFNRLSYLKDLGYNPKVIIDAGANHGLFAMEAWSAFKNEDPLILCIEGSEKRRENLSKLHFNFVFSVVGKSAKYVRFFDGDGIANTGNSIFKEDTKHFKGVKPKKVVMRTLDDLLGGKLQGKVGSMMLKLDIQGAELEALKGALNILHFFDVIYMEASIVSYNKGAPLVSEVLSFTRSQGFELFRVDHAGTEKGVTKQLDLILARPNSELFRKINAIVGVLSYV
jgi:FkbM family methyltransferase